MNGVNKSFYLLSTSKNIIVSCDFLKENRTFLLLDLFRTEKHLEQHWF